MRFTIRWAEDAGPSGFGEYKVSRPLYQGGEVVDAADYDALTETIAEAVDELQDNRVEDAIQRLLNALAPHLDPLARAMTTPAPKKEKR